MKSYGLVLSVLAAVAGCDNEQWTYESPETCQYACEGAACPELLATDLVDLGHVASDGSDVYWMVADDLYHRDATGRVEDLAPGVGWTDDLQVAGGQAWLLRRSEPVRQTDLATGRIIEHPFRGQSLVAFDDGSAVIASDQGLYRAGAGGEVLLADLALPSHVIGRRGDTLLVTDRVGDTMGIVSIDRAGGRTRLGDAPDVSAAFALVGLSDKIVYWTGFGIWVLADGDTEARPWAVGQLGNVALSEAGAVWSRRGGADGRIVEVMAQGWNEASPRRLETSPLEAWVLSLALSGDRVVYSTGPTNFGGACALVARPAGLP